MSTELQMFSLSVSTQSTDVLSLGSFRPFVLFAVINLIKFTPRLDLFVCLFVWVVGCNTLPY